MNALLVELYSCSVERWSTKDEYSFSSRGLRITEVHAVARTQ